MATHPRSESSKGDFGDRDPLSRRRAIKLALSGLGVAAVGGVVGFELIDHGVLPGKSTLDELDGACSVDAPALQFGEVGPTVSGHFFSSARQRDVGYAIAWPPGFKPGDLLPLVVMLHGDGGTHETAIKGMSPDQFLALVDLHDPKRLKTSVPTALVTVDGGNSYWHPHPDDDPMGMVINELIPLCQARGLGNEEQGIGLMGISMGGYGAIVIAEHNPKLARAVAAISPAIWTEYRQAQGVNSGAYSDAAEFERYNAVTQARALEGLPVLVASGVDDPFHPGVVAFAQAAPASTTVKFESGCHTDPFFVASEPEALAFLSRHLGTSSSR